MKVSKEFENVIKAYLDKKATEDNLFKLSYAKENKSIDECCNFILSQVKKSGYNGFADEEIFGLAVHYYDEDDLGKIEKVSARVVVNLSDHTKKELEKRAEDEYLKGKVEELKAKNRAIAEKEQKVAESKRRLAEEKKKKLQEQGQLDLFGL